jgi:hypothetical protein
MTFGEIVKTAAEMQCLIVPDRDGRNYTLYSEMEGNDDNSVCWIYPSAFNGKGSVSSTYHFPQVDGFENFTKEELIARIGYIRNIHKERYIEKRLEKMQEDFNG